MNALKNMKNGLFQARMICCLVIALFMLFSSGCDQAARHKALTTLFDGVPELPPTDQLCDDYVEQLAMTPENSDISEQEQVEEGSVHAPYDDKDCSSCHQVGASNALIKPATELCFVCHVDFIQGPNVHGPVAVGACLACHLPHSSDHGALLVKDRNEICGKCHREERLAAEMHQRLGNRGMPCVECHGVHFGKNQYFLK